MDSVKIKKLSVGKKTKSDKIRSKRSKEAKKATKSPKKTKARTTGKKRRSKPTGDVEGGSLKDAVVTVSGADAIDSLFSDMRDQKEAAAKKRHLEAKEEERRAAAAAEVRRQLDELEKRGLAANGVGAASAGDNAKPIRLDEDGLPIYSVEALGIGRGGNTPDCPFDCWCCF